VEVRGKRKELGKNCRRPWESKKKAAHHAREKNLDHEGKGAFPAMGPPSKTKRPVEKGYPRKRNCGEWGIKRKKPFTIARLGYFPGKKKRKSISTAPKNRKFRGGKTGVRVSAIRGTVRQSHGTPCTKGGQEKQKEGEKIGN